MNTPEPTQPNKCKGVLQFFAGFISVGLMTALVQLDRSGAMLLQTVILTPIVSLVLAIFPEARKVGLGALLALGIGELIFLSLCGCALAILWLTPP